MNTAVSTVTAVGFCFSVSFTADRRLLTAGRRDVEDMTDETAFIRKRVCESFRRMRSFPASEMEQKIFQFNFSNSDFTAFITASFSSLTIWAVEVADWVPFHDNVNIIKSRIASQRVVKKIRLLAFAHHSFG